MYRTRLHPYTRRSLEKTGVKGKKEKRKKGKKEKRKKGKKEKRKRGKKVKRSKKVISEEIAGDAAGVCHIIEKKSKYTTFISGTLLQSFLSYVEVLPLLLIGVATKAISCPCVGSKGWEDLIGDGTVALLSNVVDLFTTD